MFQKSSFFICTSFILVLVACQANNSLESKITAAENQTESESKNQTLANLYQQFYTEKPTDTANARQLTFVANNYLSTSENLDSANYWYQIVFTKFPESTKAPYAMLRFGNMQKDFSDQIHWFRQTNKLYGNTKEGEQALLNVAVFYENAQRPEEALKAYEEYLVMYPNSAMIKDVQISIKNLNEGKSAEDLVKEFEANRKKEI